MAERYINDTTKPILRTFSINMNDGIVSLTFSETVNISTFNATELTLVDAADSPVTMYSIQNPGTLLTNDDSTTVMFQLSVDDLNAIKFDTALFATVGTSYVIFSSDTVYDMSENMVAFLDFSNATRVDGDGYTPDQIPPSLIGFELDLNASTLLLSFNEAVNIMDFNPAEIFLTNGATNISASNSTRTYQLQGVRDSETVGDVGLTVTFSLSLQDQIQLKAFTDFATTPNNTFLYVSDQLITDTSRTPNLNIPVTADSPLMASAVHPDFIAPQLVEFVQLDFDEGTLQLSFDEPVNTLSVQFAGITILAEPGSLNSRTLVGGSIAYVPDTLHTAIEIILSDEDIFEMKLNTSLATERDNSYIQIDYSAISDQSGNPILDSSVLQVTTYIEDSTGPLAEGFTLDMDDGILTLTFDDVLDIEGIDKLELGGLAIQRDFNGLFLSDRIQLTSQGADTDQFTNSSNGYEVLIFIPIEDLNALKANLDLATSIGDTYLTLTAETIQDVNGNPAIPYIRESALLPFAYIADRTGPQLVSFELDIDGSGELVLSFSETINQEDLDTSEITLVGQNNETFVITSPNFPRLPPLSSFTIQLGVSDLNEVKSFPNLASLMANSFLAISSLAVMDTNGNNVTEIATGSPQPVAIYTPDTTQPELVDFELDMNTGVLYLIFSETINGSSFSPTEVTLRGGRVSTDTAFTLRGGQWDDDYRSYLELNLTVDDLNEIKRIIGLADAPQTTYLSLTADTIHDMESNSMSNPIVEIESFESYLVSTYSFDITAPNLVSFSLNLTSNTLELVFDETVNASSLRIDQFVLQNEILVNESSSSGISMLLPDAGSMFVGSGSGSGSASGSLGEMEETFAFTRLTVGSENASFSTSVDSTVIIINLGPDDLNDLKRQTDLATGANSTFISFSGDAVADMNGNLVAPIPQDEAVVVSSYFPDLTPPQLIRFDLDLSNETLTLYFSELINASSVDVTQLTLQGDFVFSGLTDSHTLSLGINGSVPSQPDSTQIVISLGANDLNEIKRSVGLATSVTDTFLVLTSSAVRDMNGNEVVPRLDGATSLQATLYQEDLVRPQLVAFNIDMDLGTLTLELSETVNSGSLNTTGITLQAGRAGGQNYTLTLSSQTVSSDNSTITIELSRDDLNWIKYLTELARDRESTFISLMSFTILDMNSNRIVAIPMYDAHQVSTYTADETGPTLQSFELDLTTEFLTLFFDETVNVSSFNSMYFTLQSSLPSGANYSLTAGAVLGGNSPIVTVNLDFHDLNQIKLDIELATEIGNTYLTMREGAIADLALVPNPAFPTNLLAADFTEDSTRPELLQFSVNFNSEMLTLNFDEPVNASSLQPTGITLLNDRGIPSSDLRLTGGNTTSENGLQIVINLSVDDLNEIKRLESLYVDLGTTYIAIDSATISDMNGNPVVDISASAALNASSYVNDTTLPRLLAFDLDLNSNILTFEFVETVNTSSINFTGITLQQGSNTTNQYTLTNGTLLDLADSTVVQFELIRDDLNAIKAQRIALDETTTWLTIEGYAILDQNLQPVVPHYNGQNALNVRDYVPDQVRPELETFSLDLTAEVLILEFSETVNVFDTLTITSITLASGPNAEILSLPTHTLGLDVNNTVSTDIYTPTVTIQLGRQDLNEIKMMLELATSSSNTYLAIESTAIADMKNNPVIPISLNIPQQVTSFNADFMSPVLESFDLDMNTGVLTLYYSETVDPQTLDLSQFALQNEELLLSTFSAHILTGGEVSGESTPWFTVTLNLPDLNEIKRISTLATSLDDTYIRVTAAGLQDMNGNYIVPIPSSSALKVSQYTPDQTRPQVVSFDLNLSSERLTLTFSETVNSSSVDTSGLVIQSAAFGDSPGMRRLEGGSVLTPDDTVVEIQLDASDLNYIKSVSSLATSESNTYLLIDNSTVTDMNSNLVVAIRNGRGMPVRNFTEDDMSPVLVSFDLDLDTAMIYLTFNETVNVSTLVVEEISLQNDMFVTLETTQFIFMSTGGTGSISPDWPVIYITIGDEDLNEIKRLTDLAVSPESTYLELTDFAIQDANSNYLVPTTLPVSNYTEDTTAPEVTEFIFDLNLGRLLLTFSETVNASTLDPTQIWLQSTRNTSDVTYSIQLAGGTLLTPTDNTTLTVELLKVDLDTVKALPLATSQYNTFLSVSMDLVDDMNQNPLVSIEPATAQMAIGHVPDTTKPELEDFSLDLNTGVLILTFSETVDTTTLNLAEVTLQDAPEANATFHLTSSSTWSMEFNPIVYIYFGKPDLDSLKANRAVGTSSNDTYITISNSTIWDRSGNAVVAITDGTGRQVERYNRDTTPPELESYNLDVDAGLLTLFYSETIDILSFDPTKVTLQSDSRLSQSTHSYTLTGGTVDTVDTTEAYLELSFSDLNEIKRLIYLATCTSDNTYLSLIENLTLTESLTVEMNSSNASAASNDTELLSSGSTGGSASGSGLEPITFSEITYSDHTFDMAGNPVITEPQETALVVSDCTPDTTRPQLVDFTLNVNDSTLTLTFDETVNSSLLDVTQITFYNDQINVSDFYQLTAGSLSVQSLGGQLVIEILISNTDLNEIKRREDLATAENDTLISVTQYLVNDMNGNPNIEIPQENASRVYVFIPDERPPILLTFDLDLTLERLTLSFSETINASSLNVTGITLQNSNFTSYRTLQGGYYLTPETGGPVLGPNDPILVIQLDSDDLNYIKSITDLATDLNNTYLALETLSIADMNGNLVEMYTSLDPLQVTTFTSDQVAPELTSFDLDLNTGELFLTFSETVQVSSLNASELILQADEYSPAGDQLSFTGGNSSSRTFSTSPDRPEIVVNIGISDLNEIKRLTQLATSNFTTFLTLSQLAIQDMSGNQVVPVPNGNGTQVQRFTPDSTDPQLIGVSLDLDQGLLRVTFDETVNFSSLDFTSLSLQSSQNSNMTSLQLTGGFTTNSLDSTEVEVLLNISDFNELKRIRPLATSINSTYLTIARGGILDMNGNLVKEVAPGDALKAFNVTPDTTNPLLVSFNIDMDLGSLYLTFDETVEASSLSVTSITLQDGELASSNSSTYTLTGGDRSLEDSTVLMVNFTFFDLNEIKKIRGLASDVNGSNTFITITNLTVVDMNANPVISVPDGDAIEVTRFIEDSTRPELQKFDLDMNTGIITFTFSETVDTLTFNVTQFTLQDSQNVSDVFQSFTLTEANLLTGDDVIIAQELLYFDLNTIKRLGYLATSESDTYLSVTELAIQDMNGNKLTAISPYNALSVSAYGSDSIRPLLESFDLDMDSGEITLTFSETVNVSTLNVNEILFLNSDLNATQSFFLTDSSFSTSDDWPIFIINIGLTDLNELKRLDKLATSNETTFIELSSLVLKDTAGNMNLATNETRVTLFTADNTRPELVGFDLDLSLDTLTLRFSETIRASSLDPMQLTFVNAQPPGMGSGLLDRSGMGTGSGSGSGSGSSGIVPVLDDSILVTNYTLTGAENLGILKDGTELTLKLTFDDRNELKRLVALATTSENTYISITSAFIEDMNENPVVSIDADSALNVTTYTPDMTPPQLLRYDLDMDGPVLTLFFSETVDTSSLNVSGITLQSTEEAIDGLTQSYILTDLPRPFGSYTPSGNSPVVEIEIGETDSNVIKFLTDLAQSDNTTYLVISADTIDDMNGNNVVAISDANATEVDVYLRDVTGPVLRNYSLNLTSERLYLTFDETVDFDSIIPSLIIIQNSDSSPTAYHKLSQAVPIGPNAPILVLNLTATQNDLNAIKLQPTLATNLESNYISLLPGAIHDLAMESNPILSTVEPADDFYPDLNPPEVISFDFNVNTGTLTLVFSEVVNLTSLDPTVVRLQNGAGLTESYVQLTGVCVCVCVCMHVCVCVCVYVLHVQVCVIVYMYCLNPKYCRTYMTSDLPMYRWLHPESQWSHCCDHGHAR